MGMDFILNEQRWMFSVNPVLVFLGLILMVNVTRVIREYSQGMDYDFAYSSSRIGDVCLIAMACYDIMIIQEKGQLPQGFDGLGWRVAALVIGILIGTLWVTLVFLRDRIGGQWADTYHNTVVVAVLFFFSFTCVVPVVFSHGYATSTQWWVNIALFGAYLGSIAYDVYDGRIPHQFSVMQRDKSLLRQQLVIDDEIRAKVGARK